ncbi:MAG TPA: hypothetical protein VNM47_18520 [Terriglobia bacterium]|nr:hypothetical protein [Terriglobia bacterium]
MNTDPKLYLDYLDKEMTIMGVLSAFCVALAAAATDRIATADKGFFQVVWSKGKDHVIVAGALALFGAYLFYRERSLLAWYYGQISLAHTRGPATTPKPVGDWLTEADGWDTWAPYQDGFIVLAGSAFFYACAIALGLGTPWVCDYSFLWFWVPLTLTLAIAYWRKHVLNAFPQEDEPGNEWWRSLAKRRHKV